MQDSSRWIFSPPSPTNFYSQFVKQQYAEQFPALDHGQVLDAASHDQRQGDRSCLLPLAEMVSMHARPLALEFEGALYHVTSRGDRREPIFDDDDDRLEWLTVFAEGLERFHAVAFAY